MNDTWCNVDGNEERLPVPFIDVVVAFDPVRRGYAFRIGSCWATSRYDTIDDAKRVAIASLRNKLEAALASLTECTKHTASSTRLDSV